MAEAGAGMEHIGDTLRREFPPPTPTPRTTAPRSAEAPSCWDCLGTGVVVVGEHRRFCHCAEGEARLRGEWFARCGVPVARRGETLASFRPVSGTGEALAAAREVVAGTLCWLLLYGGPGNGKSHLGHGIVLACVEAGRRARAVNALVLLSDLRAVSGTPAQSVLLRELAAVPVLVIDDLIWATDLEARWLEEVVQRRYMEKRPLVATTNRDLKELPGPLVSRFWELGRVVLNKGGDYRRRRRSWG